MKKILSVVGIYVCVIVSYATFFFFLFGIYRALFLILALILGIYGITKFVLNSTTCSFVSIFIPSIFCIPFPVGFLFPNFYTHLSLTTEYKLRASSFKNEVAILKRNNPDFKKTHWRAWASCEYSPWFVYDETGEASDGWIQYDGRDSFLKKLDGNFYFVTADGC